KSDWLQTEHSSWRKIRQSVRDRTAGEGRRPIPDPRDPWSSSENGQSENETTGAAGTVPADTGSTSARTAEAAPWNGPTGQGGAASSTTRTSEQPWTSSDNQQWTSERQQWSSENWHGSGWRWRSSSQWLEEDGDEDEDSRAWA
ncbi:unnamed protein product, partial [Symbiodinium sp. CCMP2592]